MQPTTPSRWKGRPPPKGMRILGVDDAPFSSRAGSEVLVVGCLYRVGLGLEGVLSTTIRKDGRNATRKLIELYRKSRFKVQIHVLMLDGIALGGFNVVDLPRLAKETGVVVMTVIRRRPDLAGIERALAHVESDGQRFRLIQRGGPVHQMGSTYFQIWNATPEEGRMILKAATLMGNLPEPVRLAHLIGAGVKRGESRGRA